MKTKLLFCVIAASLAIFTSCSKADEGDIDNSQLLEELLADYEPYISPELQRMFDLAEASTEPLPIEVLIPNIDELFSTEAQPASQNATRAVGDYFAYSGCMEYKTTDYKMAVNIDVEAAINLNFGSAEGNGAAAAGLYYITTWIGTRTVYSLGGKPYPIINMSTDIQGIKPDLKTKGYHVEEIAPNVCYVLTTYLFAIHKTATTNNITTPLEAIHYVIPDGNVPSSYINKPANVLRDLITWNFVVVP